MFATLSWIMNQAPNLTQFLWLTVWYKDLKSITSHLVLSELSYSLWSNHFVILNRFSQSKPSTGLTLKNLICQHFFVDTNTSRSPTMISWKSLFLWDPVSMVRFAILLYKWYILCLLQIIGLAEIDLQRLT